MMLRSAILSAILANAVASPVLTDLNSKIPATSDLGSKLLSKARLLSNDDGDEMSWIVGYDIKFVTCRHQVGYGGGDGGDNGDRRLANEAGNSMYVQRLAEFRLCPSGYCSDSCSNGAVYVVDLAEYVQAYLETQRQIKERACETITTLCENGSCANSDDDGCLDACIANNGMDYCIEGEDEENENGDGDEDMNEMACTEAANGAQDGGGDDDNYSWYYWWRNNQSYTCYNSDCSLFVGPYCSTDGQSVYMGAFTDATCTNLAPSGTWESYNYGSSLAYSTESIIQTDCISCDYTNPAEENDDGEEEEAEMEVLEMCGTLYEDALRCEENMTISYPDTSACDYIQDYLPMMDALYASKNKSYFSSFFSYGAAGIALLGLSAFGRHKYMVQKRSTVELNQQGFVGDAMS